MNKGNLRFYFPPELRDLRSDLQLALLLWQGLENTGRAVSQRLSARLCDQGGDSCGGHNKLVTAGGPRLSISAPFAPLKGTLSSL